MKNYKSVEPFNEPSSILNRIDSSSQKTEMYDSERGFLCGLLREHRPKKIVEVGVAEGGTTAVILECVRELKLNCVMYSVDAMEKLYYDKTQKVGWVLDALRGHFPGCQHTLFTGKILPEVLEEIGTDIDFLILDTAHTMPGENLDFLSAYPYLSKDAVVVLHDVHLSMHFIDHKDSIATNVLLSVVTADKYYNLGSHFVEYPGDLLPNIAAFQLNEDTPKYIMDVFTGLCLPWNYIPSREHLQLYGNALEKLGTQCMELYQRILHDQLYIANAKVKEVEDMLMAMGTSSHVLLYGKGFRGKTLLQLCKKIGVNVSAFVVSDGRSTARDTEGIPVYEYSKIPFAKDNLIMIQSAWSTEISHQLENSDYRVLNLSEEQWKWVFWYVEA